MFRMKGRLLAGLLCVMMTAALIAPASAHGCHGGRRGGHHSGSAQSVQAAVAVCPYEDCTAAGRHTHDEVIYCGYCHEDGFCDGTCRALCPYEDCQLAGYHTHDGVSYCGAAHECGFCDGTCHRASTTRGCGRWA